MDSGIPKASEYFCIPYQSREPQALQEKFLQEWDEDAADQLAFYLKKYPRR